jgi:hypothetical protein
MTKAVTKRREIVSRSEKAGRQRSSRSSEKRRGCDYADPEWFKADLSQISRRIIMENPSPNPRAARAA